MDQRSQLVAVAARLLRDEGAAAVTTRRVAQEAGVQAPTIYRLFGDKDGLLDAVAEQAVAAYVASKPRPRDGDDPLDDLRAGWLGHVEFALANPALFLLLTDPARAARMPAHAAGEEILRERVRRVAAAGRLRVPQDRAVELLRAAGVGAALTLISSGTGDLLLADALYDAVAAAILTGSAPRAKDRTRAAAVTLTAAAPDLAVLSEAERTLLAEWLGRVAQG